MDTFSSFVDISRMVNIVGRYTLAQAWLTNRQQPMAEIDL